MRWPSPAWRRAASAWDFARSHPGGALGRRLLTHVRDVMRQGDALPIVAAGTPVPQALKTMSAKGMGMTVVADAAGRPQGIFTDGDLRRLIASQGDIRGLTVDDGMTRSPRSIGPTRWPWKRRSRWTNFDSITCWCSTAMAHCSARCTCMT